MLNASVFRPVWRSLGLAVLTLLAGVLPARAATVQDGFDPNVNGPVYAVAVQPDGKILIGGLFTTVTPPGSLAGITRNNIARLNADGSVDVTFNPNANTQVGTIVLQPNGQILIGGKFTVLQPNPDTNPNGYLRNHIARLNPDGTLDQTFDPNTGDPSTGGSLTPQVNAIVLQTDGKIMIGGGFTSLQPNGATTLTPVKCIARLNADGTYDSSFAPDVNINSMVWAIAIQADGKLLVGGGFTNLTVAADNGDAPLRDRLARFNANGTLDTTFYYSNPDNLVTAIALQRDGRIVVGGNFASLLLDGSDPSIALPRSHLAALLADGTVDTDFIPTANGNIAALALQTDGKLLVGGYFGVLNSNGAANAVRAYVGRFNTDGSLDLDFNPTANYTVLAFALQPDGHILMGGNFTTLTPGAGSLTQATTRNRLARLTAEGAVDGTFEPDGNGRPLGLTVDPDGNFIVGGTFTSIGGQTHPSLTRLLPNGTIDPSFSHPPTLNGPVRLAVVRKDGKIIIAGAFTSVNNLAVANLAQLNHDGSLDTHFNPAPSGQVYAMALQSDGLIIGGSFTTVTLTNAIDLNTTDDDLGFRNRNNIARILINSDSTDGNLDPIFDPHTDGAVAAIKIQADGKILASGSFSTVTPNGSLGAYFTPGIVRLNPDGTVVSTFVPAPSSSVFSFVIQGDGKIVIAGAFTNVSRHNNTDPNLQDADDDRLARNSMARLNADGTLDPTYDPDVNGTVRSVTLQADGKVLIAGNFTALQPNGATTPTSRQYFARLNTDGTVDTSFKVDFNDSSDSQLNAVALTADKKILIAGGFNSVDSVPRTHLALINGDDGSLDPLFNPGVSGAQSIEVDAIAVQLDGKIIVGGNFNGYGGSSSQNLVRFLPDSSPDTSFTSNISATTGQAHVDTILIPPYAATTPTQNNGLASLTPDGHLNTQIPDPNDPNAANFSSDPASRITGQATTIVIQPDGKILVGGGFVTSVPGLGGNLVRFNKDGTLDTTFNPSPNAFVQAIALDSTNRILVGGAFTSICGDTAHTYIARLNPDGTLDTAFAPTPSAKLTNIIVQPDQKILVAGFFISFTTTTDQILRSYLARLNPDGTVDSFDPQPNIQPNAIVLQPDGKIILGGDFTGLQPYGTPALVTRNHMARVNNDGSLDTGFDPNMNSFVTAVGLQSDGKIVVGGSFTSAQPNGTSTPVTRNGLARFNADGTLDTDFDPNAPGGISALQIQADGKIVVAGAFVTFQPLDPAHPDATRSTIARNHLARLNANGTVDTSFDPNPNGTIANITLVHRTDGSDLILLAGTLTTLQPNGAIVIGGSFDTVNGNAVSCLALLNADGSINSTFNPNPDKAVHALLLQPDGSIVVGGEFTKLFGADHAGLARILSDSTHNNTLDTGFTPAINGAVYALARQADGRILIGGTFTLVDNAAMNYVARLNTDGSLDTTFSSAGLASAVKAILVQSDGAILVTDVAGKLTRLTTTGGLDGTFTSAATGSVTSIGLRNDGLIYAAGAASSGSGGFLTLLTATGAVDLDPITQQPFSPAIDGGITALALQPDGKIIFGGAFNTVDGRARQGLARYSSGVGAIDAITVGPDRTAVNFNHTGSGPQLVGAIIDYSTDNRVWTSFGAAARIGTTTSWQVTGVTLPLHTYYYIRVRGILPGTQYSSSGLYQFEREFYDYPSLYFTSPSAVGAIAGANFFYAAVVQNGATGFQMTGLPAGLSYDPATGIITGTPSAVGTYPVTITAFNDSGSSIMTLVIAVAATAPVVSDARLVNVSTNVTVSSAHPIISGFVIAGTEPRSVLVRGIGPSLAGMVPGPVLAHPQLDVYSRGTRILTNAGWGDSSALSSTSSRVGAMPPLGSPDDAAMALTLNPGVYSIIVTDASGGTVSGAVLAEVYDASSNPAQGAGRIVNLSSRGYIDPVHDVLIGGFVLAATAPASAVATTVYRTVLIRGIGPKLVSQGVADAISDPVVGVYDSHSQLLAQNGDWETPLTVNGSYAPATGVQLAAAANTVGAFALDAGSKDAAVLVTLPIVIQAGATSGVALYSAQVASHFISEGSAMVEIYELPNN